MLFHIYDIICHIINIQWQMKYLWWKKAISNHLESDVYAGVLLMETSRLMLLGHGCWRIGEDESCTSFECIGALGNRRATEPHLLHDCKKVMAVFLWAARVPANTPHPGLFTSKHTFFPPRFCHCHQLSVSFSAVFILYSLSAAHISTHFPGRLGNRGCSTKW